MEEQQLSQLMVSTQRGDKEACRSLLQRVEKLTRSYVSHSLSRAGIPSQERTDDIVQETLLAVYTKRATYDTAQLFLPWMYTIAKYKLIDSLRSAKRQKKLVALENAPESSLTATQADAAASIDVDYLLSLLPEKQRTVLGLVKIDGLSIAEAAERTGLSPSDVKVSSHRGIKAIQKQLGEVSHEDE